MTFQHLFSTSGLEHSELQNAQRRCIKQELKKITMKLLRFGLNKIFFFLPHVTSLNLA